MKKDTAAHSDPPGERHPLCQKCKLFSKCKTPFHGSYYYDSNGQLHNGIPPQPSDYTLVVGNVPDEHWDEFDDVLESEDFAAVTKVAEKLDRLSEIWYMPAIRCRASKNEEAKKKREEGRVTKAEITRCWKHWHPVVIANMPRAIIACGPVAAFAVLGTLEAKTAEKQWQVSKLYPGIMVYCVRSTEELYFNQHSQEAKNAFVSAFEYAFTHEGAKSVIVDIPYTLAKTLPAVQDWFAPVLDDLEALKLEPLSWDTEGSSANSRWKNWQTCLLSFDHPKQDKPLLIPTSCYSHDPIDHKTEKAIMAWLAEHVFELEAVKKVGQNLQYDELAMWVCFGILVRGMIADTQIWDFLINPDVKTHALDLLVRRHLPTVPRYWEALETWLAQQPGGKTAEVENHGYMRVPPDILYPYAAWDTKAVSMLHKLQRVELENREGGFFMMATDKPDTDTLSPIDYALYGRRVHHYMCTHMSRVGTKIDTEMLEFARIKYFKEREEHHNALANDPVLQEFERTILPTIVSKNAASAKAFRKFGTPHKINWASPIDVPKFFLDFCGLPVLARTSTNAPSLDATVINQYATLHRDNRGSAAAAHLGAYRKADKFITSFINPLDNDCVLGKDGVIHPDYKSAATATGRLACGSSYPMQAIPREGLIKKIFISHWENGWVLTRDYSGIEVRVLAIVSRDPALCEALRNGDDVHFITQRYFFKDKADAKNKTQRSICKQALFGRLYGQGDQGLYELLASKGVVHPETGQPLSLEECKAFNVMIDELYPGVAKWVELAHEMALSHYYCCSMFGFTRPLPGAQYYPEQQKLFNECRDQYGKWDPDAWDALKKDKRYRRISAMVAEAQRQAQNCADAATEILTKRGWLKYNELTLQDQIMTKNPKTGVFEWHRPYDIKIWDKSNTPVALVETQAFSACVTPEHRWLATHRKKRRKGTVREVKMMTTMELLKTGGYAAIHRTGDYITQDNDLYSDDFLRKIGWYVTDSSIKNGGKVVVGQSWRAKPANCERIRTLFKGAVSTESMEDEIQFIRWYLTREESMSLIKILPRRKLTYDFIYQLSKRQANILLEEMLLGDGGQECSEKGHKKERLYAEDQEEVDLIQALAVVAGKASNSFSRPPPHPRASSKLKKPIISKKPVRTITLLHHTTAQILESQVKWVEDQRLVWCPQVQNETFVARRNGSVYVTGNTPIQGTASDMTVFAAYVIQKRFEHEQIEATVMDLVHDDIWTSIRYAEDVPRVSAIMHDVMDNPADWLPVLLPGFKCDWMDIPIIGEAEVGLSPMDCFNIVEEPSLGPVMDPNENLTGKLRLKLPESYWHDKWLEAGEVKDGKFVVPWDGNEKRIREALESKRLAVFTET